MEFLLCEEGRVKGILIIRGGAIGDFICTLPVAAALRRALPLTPLSLVSYDRVLPLARATGFFTQMRSIESRSFAGFFGARTQLDPDWMEFFGSFGMIISFLYDPDELLEENLSRCRVKTILTMDPRPNDRHVCEHLCSILNRVAIFPEHFTPSIELAQNPPVSPPGQVAIHVGSGSEKKNWAIARWRSVLEFLVSRGLTVTVIQGEADAHRTSQLLDGVDSAQISVIRGRPLLDVASILRSVRLFVGHDSGITHLASALGAPTLALFGPTHPHLWAPRGDKTRILWKNRIWDPAKSSPLEPSEISVDDNSLELVKAQIAELLEQTNPKA
jgi:heptosyltransferase-2